ncbi:CoA pyrophosphatase [Brevundimonas sp. LjRoot202]|uniref:CoA pyrophosphatase n=1 Tax=Brevundimonas sp. LjRoot202 TaxID=3342281 RepID=UPI003ED038A1
MSLISLRERLMERLAPAAAWTPGGPPEQSDYDLNPGAARPGRTLRPAAVLVPVIARPEGATVLLTRRSDNLASHTGQIAFPGGRLDPGETAERAALREAWEEVGLEPEGVEVLGLGDAYETVTGFVVTPVVGWLAEPPVVVPSPDEVAEVFEAPWDFLMDPANHRRDFYDPESGPRRWFWAMPWQERYIWGATASIVRALRTRLYGDEAEPAAAVDEDAA